MQALPKFDNRPPDLHDLMRGTVARETRAAALRIAAAEERAARKAAALQRIRDHRQVRAFRILNRINMLSPAQRFQVQVIRRSERANRLLELNAC
jgi:hypothetical protein